LGRVVPDNDISGPGDDTQHIDRRPSNFDAVNEQQRRTGIAVDHAREMMEGIVGQVCAGEDHGQIARGIAHRPTHTVGDTAVATERQRPAGLVWVRLPVAQARRARGGDRSRIGIEKRIRLDDRLDSEAGLHIEGEIG